MISMGNLLLLCRAILILLEVLASFSTNSLVAVACLQESAGCLNLISLTGGLQHK